MSNRMKRPRRTKYDEHMERVVDQLIWHFPNADSVDDLRCEFCMDLASGECPGRGLERLDVVNCLERQLVTL